MDRKPAYNENGVVHLHISANQPEAEELAQLARSMRAKNTDHKAEQIFNPEAPAVASRRKDYETAKAVGANEQGTEALAENTPQVVTKRNALDRQLNYAEGKDVLAPRKTH